MEAVLHTSHDYLLLTIIVDLGMRGSLTLGETSVFILKKKKKKRTGCRKIAPGGDSLLVNMRWNLMLEDLTVEDHENFKKVYNPYSLHL